MPYFSSLQNFIDSVTARLTKPKRGVGGSEGVVPADLIDALTDVGKYADDMKVANTALTASFVSRSLNLNAVVYIRADVGDDTRTGETSASSGSTGAVKTLARAIQLHSGKTQKLSIRITSGNLAVDSDLQIIVPELTIMIYAGASLNFFKKSAVKDDANVTVGEGTYCLKCFTDNLLVRVDGNLIVQNHAGSSGTGNPFYYTNAQGAIAICMDQEAVFGISYQTIQLTHYGAVTVGNNATLFTYGTNGTNGYGSELARYKRVYLGGGSLTLGSNATESALKTDKLRETLVFEGSGVSKSVNIRRSYAFAFEIVYNDGCTISVQPAANCSANANNTLTFTGTAGKTLTVRLTSSITL
ncbi:hypothetical protein [Salmonirosea aquatica]|uniref:Uncharacterized protein n=1 Tax=Salmonirosea aquatica TaxID=2654236 RepID=A0A7C9F8Y5_9BACT|nr:hypothetical protein [Cytophagaceae bacterium SJW1-29]